MRQFASSVWIVDQDQKFYGIELGARMTIVDLGGGRLFIHSPIQLTTDLRTEIQKLGRVAYVVAPNKWHHLYLNDFREAFPDAKFFCAPGLERKRSDFRFDSVISQNQSYPWHPQIVQTFVAGAPMYNEIVFFHAESRTLILTDLAVHICKTRSLKTKLLLRLVGSYGKFGWSSLEKRIFIKSEKDFKRSIDSILSWDFERIVLAHGTPIEANGKKIMRAAFH